MLINLKKLLRLPVVTELGRELGVVLDVEVVVETHQVHRYIVGSRLLRRPSYLIAPTQVKDITSEKMVVVDSVEKIIEEKTEKMMVPQADLSGMVAPAEKQ